MDYINGDIDEDLDEEEDEPKRKDAQNEVIDSEIKDSMIVTQTDSIRGLNSQLQTQNSQNFDIRASDKGSRDGLKVHI